MKAVLCLWAREHLKGRPGPGSGLARLLEEKKNKKKQNTTLSSVFVRVCVCVWQRAVKQDGCARLLLAETLRGTDRVVDAEERRGMKGWFHQHWRLLISSYLLSCCRWARSAPTIRGATPPQRSLEERCRCRRGDETSLQGWLCWRITRGRKRIAAHCFHPLCLCLSVSEWSTWLLKDTQRLPAWICWIITWVTPGRAAVVD